MTNDRFASTQNTYAITPLKCLSTLIHNAMNAGAAHAFDLRRVVKVVGPYEHPDDKFMVFICHTEMITEGK